VNTTIITGKSFSKTIEYQLIAINVNIHLLNPGLKMFEIFFRKTTLNDELLGTFIAVAKGI